MKKVLFIALLGLIAVTSKAQTAFNQTAYNSSGTITNTGIDTMNYSLSRSYPLVSVQVVVTKVSGTMAGTATLYSSVNGVNYVATGTALTLTDVSSQSKIWDVASAARYFRVIVGGATTVSGTASAKISAAQ